LRVWSSPFSIERQRTFGNELPADVVNRTYATLLGSYVPGTHDNYAAGLLRFHQFCDRHEISENARMPASHFLLAAFIAEHVGTVGSGTVKSWMSGVKAWHDVNGASWEGDDRWVELARHTANKEGTAFKRDQRGPVTMEHMIALRADMDLNKPFDAALWSCATAAFWGCRRLGELTVPSYTKFDPKFHVTHGVEARDVTARNSAAATVIHIPWTKSTHEKGRQLTLTARADEFCPKAAFHNHMLVNKHVPPHAHPFSRSMRGTAHGPRWQNLGSSDAATSSGKTRRSCAFLDTVSVSGDPPNYYSPALCPRSWPHWEVGCPWCSCSIGEKIEHIIPMNIGKAYDKNKIDKVAKAFEDFHIANGISLLTTDDL
jgi:hypothetical protein